MERDSEVEQYLDPKQVIDRLGGLAPRTIVTQDGLELVYDGPISDMEWGVFDLIHRTFVHHTYENFVPVVSTKDLSVLVTTWQRLPIFFQVATARLGPGLFYQGFSVLGLLYCHQISRMTQDEDKARVVINWYLVSHRLLRFLHPIFNRRLHKLQRVQNAEDVPVRHRRLILRRRGIHFTTDAPNFINANDLNDHVILPPQSLPMRISVSGLKESVLTHVTAGSIELLLRKEGDSIWAWPSMCPHEGALMTIDHLCDTYLTCPWHGRKFRVVVLRKAGQDSMRYLGLSITREGEDLIVNSVA